MYNPASFQQIHATMAARLDFSTPLTISKKKTVVVAAPPPPQPKQSISFSALFPEPPSAVLPDTQLPNMTQEHKEHCIEVAELNYKNLCQHRQEIEKPIKDAFLLLKKKIAKLERRCVEKDKIIRAQELAIRRLDDKVKRNKKKIVKDPLRDALEAVKLMGLTDSEMPKYNPDRRKDWGHERIVLHLDDYERVQVSEGGDESE